jgi:SAM-dependent methyltransferase
LSEPESSGEPDRHWFEDVADYLGPAYLRYSFTMGTEQEVGFLIDALGLAPGDTVLDVGCGPGRHCLALAARGIHSVGVDISESFVGLATEAAEAAGLSALATFHRGDARQMVGDSRFDGRDFNSAISLCQGAFGLGGPSDGSDPQNLAPDSAVLSGVRNALTAGGRFAVSAFSSYFQVRYLEDQDTFSAATAVNHEHTELKNSAGETSPAELWTTCYTPRELRLLVERNGLRCDEIHSVTPGEYGPNPPSTESPEFLVLGTRPI